MRMWMYCYAGAVQVPVTAQCALCSRGSPGRLTVSHCTVQAVGMLRQCMQLDPTIVSDLKRHQSLYSHRDQLLIYMSNLNFGYLLPSTFRSSADYQLERKTCRA